VATAITAWCVGLLILTGVAATAAEPIIFRGDPARCGWDGQPLGQELRPLWTWRHEDAAVWSSPLVCAGRVYVSITLPDAPRSSGAIACLDATTGRQLWFNPYQDAQRRSEFTGIYSSPAISADRTVLVVGQGFHPDHNCALVCLSTADGSFRWRVPTPLHIESSPAIADGLVAVGVGAIEQGPERKPRGPLDGRGNPGYLLVVRLADGAEVFRHPLADVECAPAIADGVIYAGAGLNGNAVVALRTGTSAELRTVGLPRERWRSPTPLPVTSDVTLTADLVLVGCGSGAMDDQRVAADGWLLAFNRADGRERGRLRLQNSVFGSIAVRGRVAIVTNQSGEVVAVDLDRLLAGADPVRWRSVPGNDEAIYAGVAWLPGRILVTGARGHLSVLDEVTGALGQRLPLNDLNQLGRIYGTSAPTIAAGRVYVGSETGGLRCFVGVDR